MKEENMEIQTVQVDVPVHEQSERAHIDIQIATAKKYPRDLKRVKDNCIAIVTMDEKTAQTCGYNLPRGRKSIQGPSVHLARILAQQYGNIRAEARGIEIGPIYITCEAVAFDLETNYAVKVEVRKKIIDRTGKRYNDDMIAVTMNAGNAIAFRNAVLAVIPRSITDSVYESAQRAVTGDISSEDKLIAKRKRLIAKFDETYGVTLEDLLAVVGKTKEEHIQAVQLVQLIGLAQAIKDGDTTVDEAFGKTKGDNKDGQEVKRDADDFDKDGPQEEAHPVESKDPDSVPVNEPVKKSIPPRQTTLPGGPVK